MLVIEKMKYGFDDIVWPLGVEPSDKKTIAGFETISTDSRTIMPGALFFALKGEHYDGHQFINEAIKRGATGVVVSNEFVSDKVVVFKVDDTLKALGDLAGHVRAKYSIKCAAVTGSNGKTTTKEILGDCLQIRYKTLKSAGNFNNLVGVPLSIFALDENHEAAVFELGMSAPGEISRLAEIARPHVGAFTNIAPAHLESMGTLESIAKAKYELIDGLPDDGVAIINADNSILSSWISRIKQRVITYGISTKADFRIDDIAINSDGTSTFKVNNVEFRFNFPGRHNIYNAVCAIAASSAFGIETEELVDVIKKIKPYKLRSEIYKFNDITIINDCYNANPESMKAAIDILADYPTYGRRIAVLGDMLELGDGQMGYHEMVGSYLQLKKIDSLFATGELAIHYLTGFAGKFSRHFADKGILSRELKKYVKAGDVVLIKGSRGLAMETINEELRQES